MTNRRKYVPFIYLGIIAATIIIIASMVGLANAYFTSTADKEGEINFHNVELQINSTNQNSALFSTASTLIPGESISFSNISVKNIGTTDIYSLINLNIYIQRVGYTASVTDLWYNLDGAGVNYKNISSNTTNATKLEVNASQNLNLSYEFRSCKYNNTFKNSSVKITLRAVGIQSANLQEVEEITSEPLIASYWLINDFHVDQPNNIVDLNQFETQTSLLCDETTEQTTISDQTHSVFNFKVDNTEPGDTVYVQASNADMVSIIPVTYDLNSIDLNNLPAGSVQAQGQTVTTFTVPEQTTYALSKSIVKIDNVLSDDWDKTFTVSAVTSVNSTKKPIVMVYTTPQDDFPDVVDGVLVYQIDYLDIKNGALTFETPLETMPLDEYTIMDVSNYIVSNITENSTVTVYAYNAKASFITMDNYSLQSILEYIGQDEMPPNLVSAGLNECIYTFPVSAGTSLKFCVFSINDPTAAPSLTPKVSVYVTPTGNLPMVVDDVAYQLLEDGTGYSAFAANMFAQTANILSTINGKPVKVIKDAGFSSSSISTVTIPATVTEIGDNAFEYCYVLGNVTFETNSQLTSIGDYAFSGCEALTEIEIPASVTEIEYGAFEYCYVLGNVTFEANSQLTSIGDYAFHHCLALTEIEIPASVTEIEYGPFYGCTNLEKVTFAANSQLTSIGDNAFKSCTN